VRTVALSVGLAAVLAGCGSEGAAPAEDPFIAIQARAQDDEKRTRASAAPRWELVERIRGKGRGVHPVFITPQAIQWRVRWRCEGSRFVVRVKGRPLGRGTCSGPGRASGVRRGPIDLQVDTDQAWQMTVERQVTTPLTEPPPRGFSGPGTRLLAQGRFEGVERRGTGRAILRETSGKRRILRLEGFSTTANTDLAVWLSRARAPRTTRQALSAPYVKIADLKATIGDHNYLVPRGVRLDDIRSIVIWCEPLRIAYTTAALSR